MDFSSELLNVLDVHAGQRVLEIGMESGDMTVLLASLVGENGRVVSIDRDKALVKRVRRGIEERGIRNVVVQCADGQKGYSSGAPYDRILATVSVRCIPFAWLEQLAPGGMLVGNLAGNLVSIFLKLNKRQTSGYGRFLSLTRNRIPELQHRLPFTSSDQFKTGDIQLPVQAYAVAFDVASLLENDAFLFFLQCEMPHVQRYSHVPDEDHSSRVSLYDPMLNASLTGQTREGVCTVHVHGDSLFWEQIERCYYRWQQRGCPRPVDFHFHMKAGKEYILYPATGEVWILPEGT